MPDATRPARLATPGVFAGYRDPHTHFARRLAVVQQCVRETLDATAAGPIVIVDICAGVGSALLPVLSQHRRREDVRAWLVELDGASARQAQATIEQHGLSGVQVVEADAGLSRSYAGLPPAHLVIMSGVLAHLTTADRLRALRFLRALCAPDAILIWTIGNRWDPLRILRVRRLVRQAGFEPVTVRRVARWRAGGPTRHEVGVARLTGAPVARGADLRLFSFRPTLAERFPFIRRLARRVRRVRGR